MGRSADYRGAAGGAQPSGVSWSGCWRLMITRVALPLPAVGVSGRRPGSSRSTQDRRASAPKFFVGGARAGASRLPVVTSIASPSRNQKVSGVPQLVQKCRSAAEELRKLPGSPRVQAKLANDTLQAPQTVRRPPSGTCGNDRPWKPAVRPAHNELHHIGTRRSSRDGSLTSTPPDVGSNFLDCAAGGCHGK